MANALTTGGAAHDGTPTTEQVGHVFSWNALAPVLVVRMLESLPGAAIGLIGVVRVTLLAIEVPWMIPSPNADWF